MDLGRVHSVMEAEVKKKKKKRGERGMRGRMREKDGEMQTKEARYLMDVNISL